MSIILEEYENETPSQNAVSLLGEKIIQTMRILFKKTTLTWHFPKDISRGRAGKDKRITMYKYVSKKRIGDTNVEWGGVYTGLIIEDSKPHDEKGLMVFNNGNTYKGNYRYGKKYGSGVYTYAKNEKYADGIEFQYLKDDKLEGNWVNDVKHGEFTLIRADGTKLIQVYDKNILKSSGQKSALFINNLNKDFTEKKIRDIFKKFGEIKSLKLMKDPRNGKSLGYALVEYNNEDSVNNILRELSSISINFNRGVIFKKHNPKDKTFLKLENTRRVRQMDFWSNITDEYYEEIRSNLYEAIKKHNITKLIINRGFKPWLDVAIITNGILRLRTLRGERLRKGLVEILDKCKVPDCPDLGKRIMEAVMALDRDAVNLKNFSEMGVPTPKKKDNKKTALTTIEPSIKEKADLKLIENKPWRQQNWKQLSYNKKNVILDEYFNKKKKDNKKTAPTTIKPSIKEKADLKLIENKPWQKPDWEPLSDDKKKAQLGEILYDLIYEKKKDFSISNTITGRLINGYNIDSIIKFIENTDQLDAIINKLFPENSNIKISSPYAESIDPAEQQRLRREDKYKGNRLNRGRPPPLFISNQNMLNNDFGIADKIQKKRSRRKRGKGIIRSNTRRIRRIRRRRGRNRRRHRQQRPDHR